MVPQNINPLPLTLELGLPSLSPENHIPSRSYKEKQKKL